MVVDFGGADDVLGRTVAVAAGGDVVADVPGAEVEAGGRGVGSSSRSRVGVVSRPPPPFAAEDRPGPLGPPARVDQPAPQRAGGAA